MADDEEYFEERRTETTEEVDKEIVRVNTDSGMIKKIAVMNEPGLDLDGLQKGEHVDVELQFDDGLETFYSEEFNTQWYSVSAEYKDEEIRFKLTERWHDELFDVAGKGDTVRIKRIEWMNPNGTFERFEFENLDS